MFGQMHIIIRIMNDTKRFHHPKRYPVPLWSQPATPILSHLQIYTLSVTVVLHFPEICQQNCWLYNCLCLAYFS